MKRDAFSVSTNVNSLKKGFDERMFNAAGYHWRETPEMELIAAHKSIVYIVSKGGSLENAHSIMERYA